MPIVVITIPDGGEWQCFVSDRFPKHQVENITKTVQTWINMGRVVPEFGGYSGNERNMNLTYTMRSGQVKLFHTDFEPIKDENIDDLWSLVTVDMCELPDS